MNTNIGKLDKDVAEIIVEENRMMLILVTFFLGAIVGLALGYFLFDPFSWHF